MHSLALDNVRFIPIPCWTLTNRTSELLQTQAQKVITKSNVFLERQNSPAVCCLWLYHLPHQLVPAAPSTPHSWEAEAQPSTVLGGSSCWRMRHVPARPATQGSVLLSLDVARHSFVCIKGKLWASSAWHFLWSHFGTADCTSRSRYPWNGICLEK